MHGDYGYMEEGRLGRGYNLRLLGRLFSYSRKYWRHFGAAIVLVGLVSAADLALPFLTKMALDDYIVPTALQLRWGPSSQKYKRRTTASPGYIAVGPNRGYMSGEFFKKLDPRLAARLRRLGVVSRRRVYSTTATPELISLVRGHQDKITVAGGRLYLTHEALSRLPGSLRRQIRGQNLGGLWWLGAAFLIISLIHLMAWIGQLILLEAAGQRMMHRLRMDLFTHLLGQSLAFFRERPMGRLVTRTTNDVQNIAEMFKAVVNTLFQDLILLAGIIIVMLRMDARLAWWCFGLIPLILAASWVFSRLSRQAFRQVRDRLARLNAFIQEFLSGIRESTLFNQVPRQKDRFNDLNQSLYRAGLRQVIVFALFGPVVELMGALGLGLIIWYGGGQVIQDQLSLGVLVAFIAYIQLFFRPIRDLAEKYNLLQSANASAERIFQLMDTDTRLPQGESPPHGEGGRAGRIEFQGVSFRYREDQPVLDDVSFTAEPGQTVALVGTTGEGKTSLIHLLLRFYLPDTGRIRWDGVDIRDLGQDDVLSQTGLVMQDVFLFDTTVAENIALGAGREVGREEIVDAARAVRADDFITSLPGGYDHVLIGGGATLSAGQKQLLAFARALVRRPQVLILDEATSAVDPATESRIQEALPRLMAGRTTIVIAHRLSTIRRADKICVLSRGRVAEEGRHQELMAKKGLYHRLVKLQAGIRQ
ncbi:MAG: ABC transporter ATP-binding protein/permease [Proteobacteria bacterium]|nr:ABC transporter ATP-binding protein/permease [Pseudomonadota bacterium]